MAQGSWSLSNGGDRCDGLPLLSMRHTVLRTRTLGNLKHLSACRPDRQDSFALADLDSLASEFQDTWQAIENAIIGHIPIPGHFAFFRGEALPRKGGWQRKQILLQETIHRTSMRRAMNTSIDALAPRIRLAIEIVEIGKGDPAPQALLDVIHR